MLNRIFLSIYEWNWAEIAKIGVSIWVAIVATLALKTWKRQSKAQKQIDFLDEITNSVHEFLTAMSAPIETVKYIKIGFESYASTPNLDHKIENPGAVAYIQKRGEEDSKKLTEYLKLCVTSLNKIRSLSAKGQVLGFKNYSVCQNSCMMLTWQYDRIQSLCYLVGSPSLNWYNPEIQNTLKKYMELDSEKIKKETEDNYVSFLTFVKENYEKIYK
jgi:hypothetical protein